MCGFTGFLGKLLSDASNVTALLAAMGERIHTRGPDSADTWHDASALRGESAG